MRPGRLFCSAVVGIASGLRVKRNRFIKLSGGTRTVNRELADKARSLAGLNGYVTNLQARPIYHRKRDSIEAHLSVVLAALAISRWIEHATGWSVRRFVKTAAATAPFTSRPAITSSPPLTRYPTTSVRPSKPSTAQAEIRPASLTGNLRLHTGPGRAGPGLLAGGRLSTTGGARS
jgi:hypothetical protein